jgi:flagellar export protein FliJ
MKRFVFRLERLLQLRESAERDQARILADALREEEAARGRLRVSQARLAEAETQYRTTPRDLSQAGTLQNLELTIQALAREAGGLSEVHDQSIQQVEQERHQFEQARMARRVIERLREHRRDAWGENVSRLEQSESDDVALERVRRTQEER